MNIPTSKLSDSIEVKTEVGIAHYLSHSVTGYGLTYRTSTHGGSAPGHFPFLLVRVVAIQSHPELPPADGTYLVDIETVLYWSASGPDHNERSARMDDALNSISCALWDLTSAQSFLNLASTGVDSRPVSAYHLHDIEPSSANLSTSSSEWVESRSFVLTVVAADQTFAATPSAGNTGDLYYRPDGTSLFRRPGGSDRYLRP